jgi:anti-sigma factor RsiW
MKHHPDDDQLLQLGLGVLPAEVEQEVQGHLAQCAECAEKQSRLRRETDLIGSLEPEIGPIHYPLRPLLQRRSPAWVAVMRVAALVAVGFVAGYAVSYLGRPEPVTVVPYYATEPNERDIDGPFVFCEAVDTETLGD